MHSIFRSAFTFVLTMPVCLALVIFSTNRNILQGPGNDCGAWKKYRLKEVIDGTPISA